MTSSLFASIFSKFSRHSRPPPQRSERAVSSAVDEAQGVFQCAPTDMSAGNAQAPTSDGAGVAGAPDAPDTGAWPESDERRTQRFTIELEFVQCLAHPMYLSCELAWCWFCVWGAICGAWLGTQLTVAATVTTSPPWCASDLAQHPKKLLNDAAFVGYLEYLQYWRSSEYARFIRCGGGVRCKRSGAAKW